MKISQLLAAICLLFTFSFVHSQTIQIKGAVVNELKTKEGKIIVYLPDDMRTGDVISGTVVAEPNGKNEKEKNKNQQQLEKYKVNVAGTSVTLSGGLKQKVSIPSLPQNPAIILLDEKNVTFSNTNVVSSIVTDDFPPRLFSIPTHALTGSSLRITGPFDGNASNTQCRLDGNPMEILAESPRQTICSMPSVSSGSHTITVEEKGKTIEQKISCVNMELAAAKTNLKRGESTVLTVTVTGLQGIKENIPLTVINTSPSTITMLGGNTQVININPTQIGSTGTFLQNFTVSSLNTGNFSVNADLSLPDPSTTSNQTTSASLCNCYLNQQTFLIPPQTCITLGGALDPPPINNQTIQPGPGLTNPPIVSFPPPGAINSKTGEIILKLIAQANDVVAVIFSEQPVMGANWIPVGYAVNNGNTWNYNWTAPLGNDGEHIIRARVVSKDNVITERFTQTLVQTSTYVLNPGPGEKISLTITNEQIKNADQKTKQIIDSLEKVQERLDSLRQRYDELQQNHIENTTMADELAAIDKVIEQVPGHYRDSLKALIDSLNKLKSNLPQKVDPAALQKAADDAAQRQKDCQDRLDKLKAEKEQAQKELDALNDQIEDLLDQMDQLHLGNNWIGGHGYHSDGSFWYGYVGDERSNTNIDQQANAIANQLKGLKKSQNAANNRVKALNAEIADAEAECDKLKKEQDKAEQAAKDGDQYAAAETQIDELCRQIESLMSALQDWCAAHPGICDFDTDLPANPRTPEELQSYLDELNNIIKEKQQKEADLEKEAEENASEAQSTEDAINGAEDEKNGLEDEKTKAQADADKLRAEREKQLEAERAKQRQKEEEDKAKKSTPTPKPTLSEPINPSDMQLKFQAISALRELYRDYLISKGPCDCITKALALANNTNTAATDIIGGIAVGVAFAPLEAFPGFSLAARLGIGAAKALGSALFGGENFSDELAKNLFNVIGGEIFPKLVGSETAGNSLNTLAGKGLEEILKEEGIRTSGWEGETELRGCGKVKGKTTMLFNPNTGWVTLLIKIDNCPLIVVKYKVNKDGVPISKPTVTKVNG